MSPCVKLIILLAAVIVCLASCGPDWERVHREQAKVNAEADEWRRRILARQQFLEMDEHSSPVRAFS